MPIYHAKLLDRHEEVDHILDEFIEADDIGQATEFVKGLIAERLNLDDYDDQADLFWLEHTQKLQTIHETTWTSVYVNDARTGAGKTLHFYFKDGKTFKEMEA